MQELAGLTRLEFLNLSQTEGTDLPTMTALSVLPLQSIRVPKGFTWDPSMQTHILR